MYILERDLLGAEFDHRSHWSGFVPSTIGVTVSGMRSVESGQTVVARIPEDAIHLFDRETGEALHNRELERTEVAQTNL